MRLNICSYVCRWQFAWLVVFRVSITERPHTHTHTHTHNIYIYSVTIMCLVLRRSAIILQLKYDQLVSRLQFSDVATMLVERSIIC